MSDEQVEIDYEALRERFPWVGLGSFESSANSGNYREIMARARIDREALDALDEVRRRG